MTTLQIEENQHFIYVLSKSYHLPWAQWEDPLHVTSSPARHWVHLCCDGYFYVSHWWRATQWWWRDAVLTRWRCCAVLPLEGKCPAHSAQLSMRVWKYNTQMSRNKNILNLKKWSNTIGNTSELEMNPTMSKKENPRNVSTSAAYQTPNETYALHPLCPVWISCPDQYPEAWHTSSFEALSTKLFPIKK